MSTTNRPPIISLATAVQQIGSRLAAHVALLRRWLEALQRNGAAV